MNDKQREALALARSRWTDRRRADQAVRSGRDAASLENQRTIKKIVVSNIPLKQGLIRY